MITSRQTLGRRTAQADAEHFKSLSEHHQDIVAASRDLMYAQTQENRAPAWLLTEMAIEKGRELCKHFAVTDNEVRLVLASLYLAHTIFSPIWRGEVQQNHPKLSADFVRPYLKSWGVTEADQQIILTSIEDHHKVHNTTPSSSLIPEIVKNAECVKFVTLKGALIWLHELGLRGVPYDEAVVKVLKKMEEKQSLLTLDICIRDAKKECAKIKKLFG